MAAASLKHSKAAQQQRVSCCSCPAAHLVLHAIGSVRPRGLDLLIAGHVQLGLVGKQEGLALQQGGAQRGWQAWVQSCQKGGGRQLSACGSAWSKRLAALTRACVLSVSTSV